MKYLTPELYVKINEATDDQGESLYEQRNAAGANTRAHLQKVKGKLPPKMQQFFAWFCLHDAEIVSFSVSGSENGTRTPVASIGVRQDTKLIWLVYDLYEEPTITAPMASNVFQTDPDQRQ